MLNETQNFLARLAAADRAHQKEAGGAFLLRWVKYACAFVLFAFVLDVAFHLNSGWRLGLLLVLLAAVIALSSLAWYMAFVRRNRAEHIARFLETRDAALGSRLINLLQISAQGDDATLPPLTRDLARRAAADYAAGLREVPLARIARTDAIARHLRKAVWAVLGFAVILAVGFRVSAVELARFADPFGDHPPYSFTRLEIVQPGPGGTNVLYDKGLVVRVKASGHRPGDVYLTSFPTGHPEQSVTLPMFEKIGATYDQTLDNIRAETMIFAHTKDRTTESKAARIGVTLMPQLEKVLVQLTPPAYTGKMPEEKPYEFKGIQALEGTQVRFRLQSNRPLRDGVLAVDSGDKPPLVVTLKKSGDKEVVGSFVATDSGRMRVSVVDVAGNPSQGESESALTVTHDLPPTVHLANPDHDSFVALDFKLEAQIEASDDYGLREVRLHRGLNGIFSPPKIFAYTNIVRDSRETFAFNFAELGVQPGDVITLFAEAIDNAPQPHLGRSQTVRLSVISVEDYNNFLREQNDIADAEAKYSDLNDTLQSLIEQQKQLGEDMEKLNHEAAKADSKGRAALTPQLDTLIAKQNELNEKLNQQAEKMENFVREDPLYDVETDMQEVMRREAETIRASTRTNAAANRDVAQRSSPPDQARQLTPAMPGELKKASDDQLAQLSGVHEETEKEIVQTLADMDQMQELQKDFGFFETLYHAQQDLAEQARPYNRPGQLSREDQLALQDLATREKEVADALGDLQERLGHDAGAAEKLFPKAAQSGRDLAKQIGQNQLQPIAKQATDKMLAGGGEESFLLAERLRGVMEKMFSECQGGNCPAGDELDNYLRLQHANPKNNFAQMARSRKLGLGQGKGRAQGQGEGMQGSSGYAVTADSPLDVLGNESRARNGSKASRQSSRLGHGEGGLAGSGVGEIEKPDALKGLNPVNRQSAAVSSEAVMDEYNDVVENYFKAITSRKDKAAHDK